MFMLETFLFPFSGQIEYLLIYRLYQMESTAVAPLCFEKQ